MKNLNPLFIAILALLWANASDAQYCDFLAITEGTSLSYENLNAKGKVTAKSKTTYLDIRDSSGATVYDIETVFSKANGDYLSSRLGVDNKRIPENLKKAYESFPDVAFITRTPLIPGINSYEEHIQAVLEFIKPYKNVVSYELLTYHRFGLGKYEFLGKVYELQDYTTPSKEVIEKFHAMID